MENKISKDEQKIIEIHLYHLQGIGERPCGVDKHDVAAGESG